MIKHTDSDLSEVLRATVAVIDGRQWVLNLE